MLPTLIKNKLVNLSLIAIILFTAIFQFFLLAPQQVYATGAQGFIRLDRMQASTATTGGVCFTPQSGGTVAKVQVTFPSGYTVSGTTGNWTTNTTNLASGSAQVWPGIGTATAVSGQSVTFPSSALTNGNTYCFNWANSAALTTATAGSNQTGSIQTQTSGGIAIETANVALANIANDQIAVSATVSATFSFSINSNTQALGTLTTSGATSAPGPITATISTNAQSGWAAWIKSANAALNSANSGGSIASGAFVVGSGNITDLASVAGYVLDVQNGTGSTIPAEYLGNGSTSGGNLATTFKLIANATAPANANTFTMTARARASNTTKAASDYSDTLTITASGLF